MQAHCSLQGTHVLSQCFHSNVQAGMCFHTHTNLQTVQPRRTIGVGVSHSRTIHSHDITSSDTMSTQSLTPAVLANRMADPLTWPCGCDGINGVTRQNCRAPCCIVPATTPDGQDTPAWAAKVALREEIESGIAQPNFGTPGSPNITTKFTHEAVSGYTYLKACPRQRATSCVSAPSTKVLLALPRTMPSTSTPPRSEASLETSWPHSPHQASASKVNANDQRASAASPENLVVPGGVSRRAAEVFRVAFRVKVQGRESFQMDAFRVLS